MERVPWTRRPVPTRVTGYIFALFLALLALPATQGWRLNYRVVAALRAEGALHARFRQDPRFADLSITRSTGGSITVSGNVPSPRDLLDLRSLVPLDLETVLESVGKTKRLVITHESVRSCGPGAEIAAAVGEELFGQLAAPIARVAASFTPVPRSGVLEAACRPGAAELVAAIKGLQ